jgi:multidrug resistance efflux pump
MKKALPYLLTLAAVVLAVVAAALLYHRYLSHPWTRDGQVRANIVGIAPRVAGPVIQIPIKDNQPVKKGDLLFEIDPSTYQAAVDNAAAKLQQAQAQALQTQQNLQRQTELYKTNVVGQEAYQDAQDQYASATANVAAAQAQLETAQLNLSYTKVLAPVDGYLTNVNTSPGTYVNAGEQLLALVDATSFWVAGYFKETEISHIRPGDKARLTLMGHAGLPFEGVVESTGWAIFMQDGATVQLIPQVAQTIDWVRLPQRFPVRIQIVGKPPVPLRIGQTVSISVFGE